ncbi:hypothetical protein [Brevibacillus formosus]|uniref:hypothetical protein n=1 Tax=Brevibacillus formosus TaxID=54913 RepID=UPI003F1A4D44
MLNLLAPVIEERVDQLTDGLLKEDDLHERLIALTRQIGKMELMFEIENIFILMTKQAVECGYKGGLLDMAKIKK